MIIFDVKGLGVSYDNFLSLIFANFVLEIDSFVQNLQDHSEYKVKIITLIKGLGIGLIFAVCIITIRLMQVQVLKPLQQIFAASNQIRKGEFDVSFDFFYENEINPFRYEIPRRQVQRNNFSRLFHLLFLTMFVLSLFLFCWDVELLRKIIIMSGGQ